jgi:hypothetical protein
MTNAKEAARVAYYKADEIEYNRASKALYTLAVDAASQGRPVLYYPLHEIAGLANLTHYQQHYALVRLREETGLDLRIDGHESGVLRISGWV